MDYKGLLKLIKKYSLYLWIKGKTQDKNVLFLVPNSIYEMIFAYIINLIEIKQLNNSKLTNMTSKTVQKLMKKSNNLPKTSFCSFTYQNSYHRGIWLPFHQFECPLWDSFFVRMYVADYLYWGLNKEKESHL